MPRRALPARAGGRTGGARRVSVSAPRPALGAGLSVAGEGGQVPRRVAADLRAGDAEDLRAVHGAHDLAAAGRHAGGEEQPVEVDPLVAQRVAFVDADDGGREPGHVLAAGEGGPRQRVALVESLEAITQ